jgi:hypothetical protein
MSIVTYKGVYATQTTVSIDGEDIDAWEAECIVQGCYSETIGYLFTKDPEGQKNTLKFDLPGGYCEHFMPHEFYSMSNFEFDAVFPFGIVEDTEQRFKPRHECWNLV